MPSRTPQVANRLPLWAWLFTILTCGGATLYCASSAFSGEQVPPLVRLFVAMLGTLCCYAVQRGGGWTRFQSLSWDVRRWLRRGHPSEHIAVYALSVGLAAALYPISTHCGGANAREQASISHLKLCGLGMLLYAQDYDQTLPPRMDGDVLRNCLGMYTPIHDPKDDLFQDPISGRPFVWRQDFGRLSVGDVTNAEAVIVAYSPSPFGANRPRRAALLLDGHVKVMYEDVFQRSRYVNPEHRKKIDTAR